MSAFSVGGDGRDDKPAQPSQPARTRTQLPAPDAFPSSSSLPHAFSHPPGRRHHRPPATCRRLTTTAKARANTTIRRPPAGPPRRLVGQKGRSIERSAARRHREVSLTLFRKKELCDEGGMAFTPRRKPAAGERERRRRNFISESSTEAASPSLAPSDRPPFRLPDSLGTRCSIL